MLAHEPIIIRTELAVGGAEEDRTPDLLRARQALSQLSYGPPTLPRANATSKALVGLGGFEPPTSPLSGVRSNQLSYRPWNRVGSINARPQAGPSQLDSRAKERKPFVWGLLQSEERGSICNSP
jgi:hypothetical protein